jgi:hypothetical protein
MQSYGRGKFFKQLCYIKFCSFLAALFFILPCRPTCAQPVVVAGSDYFQTVFVTDFDFTGIPTVFFTLGIAYTVVPWNEDADLSTGSDTIDIELVSLSPGSAEPVFVASFSFFNAFVRPILADLTKNQGQLTIVGDSTGGTFDSFFDLFVDLTIDDGLGFSAMVTLDLVNQSTPEPQTWSPVPLSLAFLVEGLVDDLTANFHIDLDVDELDFFPVAIFGTDAFGPLVEEHPFAGQHGALLAAVV